jgi:hypothetical protein
VRVALEKLTGVESAVVSLEGAVAVIQLKPGNTVTLAQVRKIIKDGGFNSGPADLEVVGALAHGESGTKILVSGTSESFLLVPDPKAPDAFRWVREVSGRPSGPVMLWGRVETNGTLAVVKGGAAR